MYRQLMVPVDLAHADRLQKALDTAGDLAKHYACPVCFVGVTAATPGAVAHTPDEFERKLEAFGREQAERLGVEVATRTVVSHDPSTELDRALLRAVDETGAALVVMGSHPPGFAEHLVSSNAGYVAQHARVSVLVVR